MFLGAGDMFLAIADGSVVTIDEKFHRNPEKIPAMKNILAKIAAILGKPQNGFFAELSY